jgi:hypothetical protein
MRFRCSTVHCAIGVGCEAAKRKTPLSLSLSLPAFHPQVIVSAATIDWGIDEDKEGLGPFVAALRRADAAAGAVRRAATGGGRLVAYLGRTIAVGEMFGEGIRKQEMLRAAFKVSFEGNKAQSALRQVCDMRDEADGQRPLALELIQRGWSAARHTRTGAAERFLAAVPFAGLAVHAPMLMGPPRRLPSRPIPPPPPPLGTRDA